ncbi:unnamed protein product, partial [Didymodactylos carnosus]
LFVMGVAKSSPLRYKRQENENLWSKNFQVIFGREDIDDLQQKFSSSSVCQKSSVSISTSSTKKSTTLKNNLRKLSSTSSTTSCDSISSSPSSSSKNTHSNRRYYSIQIDIPIITSTTEQQYNGMKSFLEFESSTLARSLFQHGPYGTQLVDIQRLPENSKIKLTHPVLKLNAIFYKYQSDDVLNYKYTQEIFVEKILLPRIQSRKHTEENIIQILRKILDRIENENGRLLSILSFSDTHVQDVIDHVDSDYSILSEVVKKKLSSPQKYEIVLSNSSSTTNTTIFMSENIFDYASEWLQPFVKYSKLGYRLCSIIIHRDTPSISVTHNLTNDNDELTTRKKLTFIVYWIFEQSQQQEEYECCVIEYRFKLRHKLNDFHINTNWTDFLNNMAMKRWQLVTTVELPRTIRNDGNKFIFKLLLFFQRKIVE